MVMKPPVAAGILALGLVFILADFLRPGRVVPIAIGCVMMVLGLWGLLPQHVNLAIVVVLVAVPIAAFPIYFALRARRNKRV
jgi:membrane-bound ClpP family serine protease